MTDYIIEPAWQDELQTYEKKRAIRELTWLKRSRLNPTGRSPKLSIGSSNG